MNSSQPSLHKDNKNILKFNTIFHVYIYSESYIVPFIGFKHIYLLTFMSYVKKSQGGQDLEKLTSVLKQSNSISPVTHHPLTHRLI